MDRIDIDMVVHQKTGVNCWVGPVIFGELGLDKETISNGRTDVGWRIQMALKVLFGNYDVVAWEGYMVDWPKDKGRT